MGRRLVVIAAARADCAINQMSCMFPSTDPIATGGGIEQHACSLGVGFEQRLPLVA